eukprot:GHVS01024559.1.p1 GENE.GHVS01024559.1~~GHVS01024559.1.p1  ORF type:complete len:134 (-),score=24.05 GHVS01024559.1:260-661(-)
MSGWAAHTVDTGEALLPSSPVRPSTATTNSTPHRPTVCFLATQADRYSTPHRKAPSRYHQKKQHWCGEQVPSLCMRGATVDPFVVPSPPPQLSYLPYAFWRGGGVPSPPVELSYSKSLPDGSSTEPTNIQVGW